VDVEDIPVRGAIDEMRPIFSIDSGVIQGNLVILGCQCQMIWVCSVIRQGNKRLEGK